MGRTSIRCCPFRRLGWRPDDEDGRYLSSELEIFRRVGDRSEPPASGRGAGWRDPAFVRPDVPANYAVLGHFHVGGGPLQGPSEQQPTWRHSSAYGFTGRAAETRSSSRTGTARRRLQSRVAAWGLHRRSRCDTASRVRVRRGDGKILLELQFSPPNYAWRLE